MNRIWVWSGLAFLCFAPWLVGEEIKKADAATCQVPYRLTETKHVLVRAKINGKGPYNFILDTGAPALYVTTGVCKKLAIEAGSDSWGTFDRFEIEGGVLLAKARGRIEDPFQLEGMNGLGLAGAQIHGIIGYNILARYQLEFDFTKDRMAWTKLNYEPAQPEGIGRVVSGGLDAIASVMKLMGSLLGRKANPDLIPRGFLGIELGDAENGVVIKAVLLGSPADVAKLEPGDRITQFQGKPVRTILGLQQLSARIAAGESVEMTIHRAGRVQEVTLKAGNGL